MGQGYFRNVDDGYSDPDLLSAAYKIGRSAYFEVELTLAEFNDRIIANGGGLQGSPNLIAATAAGPGGIGYGCPEKDQFIWIGSETQFEAVKAKTLLKLVGNIRLYNPITAKFNLLIGARLLENVDIYQTTSFDGTQIQSSLSHVIIRNTADKFGVPLSNHVVGGEVLRAEKSPRNIFQDTIKELAYIGKGDVIEISLKSEFIYACGTTRTKMLLAHNQKEPTITI